MPHLNEDEKKLIQFTILDLMKKLKEDWPTNAITSAAFMKYIPESPDGETVVQVQIRIVTDEDDFIPDFTVEYTNNKN